jgi:hypothetical protein
MSTCLLKRILPFMLTLVIGLGLGSLFGGGYSPNREMKSRRHTSCAYTLTTTRLDTSGVTPLTILFEPSTHMTPAARAHETYGVVQLLIEYGADGHARVLSRITTLPYGLTEEAESVAERTEFRPEMINGQPVSVTRLQAYYFDMARF